MATQTLNQLNSGVLSGNPALWVSGATVAQRQLVLSPADDEIYRRKTASGSGTTDPADDLTNYVGVSLYRSPAIVNAWSSGAPASLIGSLGGVPSANIPVISAGVRTLAYSATGKGTLTHLALTASSPSSSTNVRLELIVDGRTIFDATNTYANSTIRSVIAAGHYIDLGGGVSMLTPTTIGYGRTVAVYVTPDIATLSNVFTMFTGIQPRG